MRKILADLLVQLVWCWVEGQTRGHSANPWQELSFFSLPAGGTFSKAITSPISLPSSLIRRNKWGGL
jgi:hypothetical protein